MKQKLLGKYYLNRTVIDIYVREGDGGEFYFTPDDVSLPRIVVGLNEEDFTNVVDVLLHEVYEFGLSKMGLRFKDTGDCSWDHTRYLFVLQHTDFTELNSMCARVLTTAIPDIKKAWKKYQKKWSK